MFSFTSPSKKVFSCFMPSVNRDVKERLEICEEISMSSFLFSMTSFLFSMSSLMGETTVFFCSRALKALDFDVRIAKDEFCVMNESGMTKKKKLKMF